MGFGHAPFSCWHPPLLFGQVQDQEEQLCDALIGREVASGPDGPAQLGVQGLDGIRGINDPTDVIRKSEERDHGLPVPAPGHGDRRIFLAPIALGKGLQGGSARIGVSGFVDLLQRRSDGPPVLVGHEVERVADQVHDAGLNLSFGEDGGDRVRETFEPIDHSDQNILEAAVFELGHHPKPEFSAFCLLDPKAENFLLTVDPHTEHHVDSFVAHRACAGLRRAPGTTVLLSVADLDPQRVEKDQGVERLKRTVLPFGYFVQYLVCDRADQIR